MAKREPLTELQPNFSSAAATPTTWAEACEQLTRAAVYWLATVRPDRRPHVTPLVGVWVDDALHFCTGEDERKTQNLGRNAHCVITTGCNTLSEGLDLVVEGDAVRVTDEATLQRLASAYQSKYAPPFHFTVRDHGFAGDGGVITVFEVVPTTVFGFGKGASFSQTRWRF